jgi:hypothetical protein
MRHLPVIERGLTIGMLSKGDLLSVAAVASTPED